MQRIIVRKTTGAWGRHLGTVIGVMTGLLVGGYVTGQVADSAGVGIPLFLTLASGMTVAGYYTGRQLDTRVTVIRVVPDRPQQRDRHLTMPSAIVVVGSLNADLVVHVPRFPRPGETLSGHGFARFPGGKGANQAYAAARLGGAAAMVGQVGADEHGAWLTSQLAGAGVDTSFVLRDDREPTGVALITIDADGQNQIVLAPGANGAFTPDRFAPLAGAVGSCRVLLLQLEIPMDTVLAAARAGSGRRRDRDPRPGARSRAAGRARRARRLSHPERDGAGGAHRRRRGAGRRLTCARERRCCWRAAQPGCSSKWGARGSALIRRRRALVASAPGGGRGHHCGG